MANLPAIFQQGKLRDLKFCQSLESKPSGGIAYTVSPKIILLETFPEAFLIDTQNSHLIQIINLDMYSIYVQYILICKYIYIEFRWYIYLVGIAIARFQSRDVSQDSSFKYPVCKWSKIQ